MTTPPHPQGPQGPWPGQQPPPGQPPTPPPGYPMPSQQYGPPPGQYPGWPPAGPPKKSNGLKWVLAGVALVAVIAVAVAVTAVVLRSDSGGGGEDKGGSGSTSDIASANDTGPVGVITAEPTCDKFMPINNALAAEEKNGWAERDPSIPASEWSDEQRTQYEAVGVAMRNAADQYVTLAKQTPHRVIRELYEQSIAYMRAYADSIPAYSARDDYLVGTATSANKVLVNICDSITYGAAGSRSILATPGMTSIKVSEIGDLSQPKRFMTSPDSICPEWIAATDKYSADLKDWVAIDAGIPAPEWTPEQKDVYEAAAQTFLSDAESGEKISEQTSNPVTKDFLALASQYKRVYAKAIPTYIAADGYLAGAGNRASAIIRAACQAVGG